MDTRFLCEQAEIVELMNRYARGIDLRDWPLYRSCFEDRFAIESRGWPDHMDADEWVDIIRSGIERYQATHHQMSNHSVEIDGDRAESITYIRAVHHQPEIDGEPRWTLVGYYRLGLVRSGGAWRIARFHLEVLWNEGNARLIEIGPQPPAR